VPPLPLLPVLSVWGLSLSGCTPERTGDPLIDIPACPDAECRVEVAVAAWASGPVVGLAALEKVPSPEERLVVARSVLESGQPVPPDFCRLLDAGAQDYCARLTHRPHLFEGPRPTASARSRPAGGPTDPELLPTIALTSAVDGWTASGGCADEPCADETALSAARGGDLEAAGRACLVMDPGKWRSECLFQAAEQGVKSAGGRVYGVAVELCLAAGEFQPHCMAHLVSQLAQRAPPADARGGWDEALAISETIAQVWGARDPALGALTVDRFWAEALYVSYESASRTVGNPADALPAAAAPHIRAALVHRLMRHDRPGGGLDAQVVAAESALAARSGGGMRAPQRRSPAVVRNLWENESAADADIRAVFYMGPARRGVAQSPQADLAICVMESAARMQPMAGHLIDQGRAGTDPVVRWTAKRLSRR